MADERNLMVKIAKGSPEDQWLRAQGNQSESIRALIRTAISQIGNVDFKELLVNSAIDNGNVRLFGKEPTPNKESIVNSSKEIKDSEDSSKDEKVISTKNKSNEFDYNEILNNPGLSTK